MLRIFGNRITNFCNHVLVRTAILMSMHFQIFVTIRRGEGSRISLSCRLENKHTVCTQLCLLLHIMVALLTLL